MMTPTDIRAALVQVEIHAGKARDVFTIHDALLEFTAWARAVTTRLESLERPAAPMDDSPSSVVADLAARGDELLGRLRRGEIHPDLTPLLPLAGEVAARCATPLNGDDAVEAAADFITAAAPTVSAPTVPASLPIDGPGEPLPRPQNIEAFAKALVNLKKGDFLDDKLDAEATGGATGGLCSCGRPAAPGRDCADCRSPRCEAPQCAGHAIGLCRRRLAGLTGITGGATGGAVEKAWSARVAELFRQNEALRAERDAARADADRNAALLYEAEEARDFERREVTRLTAVVARYRDALVDTPGNLAAVANAVLDDLLDRRGIKQELTAVMETHPETWTELRGSIGRVALAALRARVGDVGT